LEPVAQSAGVADPPRYPQGCPPYPLPRRDPNVGHAFRTDRAEGRQDLRGERQDDYTDRRDDRQDYRDEVRDDRQDYRDDVRDDRQDYYDDRYDRWDNWGAGAAVVAGAAIVGSAITAAAYYDLDCTTVIVDGFSYSDCGGT
jgi:hypothetical protein